MSPSTYPPGTCSCGWCPPDHLCPHTLCWSSAPPPGSGWWICAETHRPAGSSPPRQRWLRQRRKGRRIWCSGHPPWWHEREPGHSSKSLGWGRRRQRRTWADGRMAPPKPSTIKAHVGKTRKMIQCFDPGTPFLRQQHQARTQNPQRGSSPWSSGQNSALSLLGPGFNPWLGTEIWQISQCSQKREVQGTLELSFWNSNLSTASY